MGDAEEGHLSSVNRPLEMALWKWGNDRKSPVRVFRTTEALWVSLCPEGFFVWRAWKASQRAFQGIKEVIAIRATEHMQIHSHRLLFKRRLP